MTQPTYYKALWHNCRSCRIHYMSEEPHIRAYLCDECWTKLPHYKVGKLQRKQTMKKRKRKRNGQPTTICYTYGHVS